MRILALDAGQSSSTWRLGNDTGTLPALRTDLELADQLAQFVAATPAADAVAIGTTGLTDAARVVDEVAKRIRMPLWLAHDSVTSHLGLVGLEPGVSVAAGTGIVTLAVSETRAHRVDGYGWILGDEGSGFWIGAEGIRAALRALDGRAAPTRLQELAAARFGSLPDLYMRLQASPTRVSEIAAFCADVCGASDDETAREIVTAAGFVIARSTAAAIRGAAVSAERLRVRVTGGVFRADNLLDAYRAALPQFGFDTVDLACSPGASLNGAALLPNIPASHPLASSVFTAVG